MKVELKKLRVYERMSEETTAFVADVYINGKNVGEAKNDGRGGETELQFYHEQGSPLRKLCDEAFAWAKTLPDRVVDMGEGRQPFTYKVNLVDVIDEQVEDFLKKKEEAKQAKLFEKGFAWGKPNAGSYMYSKLPKGLTFAKMLSEQNIPAKQLLQTRIDVLKKRLKDGEVILNATYLRSLGFEV